MKSRRLTETDLANMSFASVGVKRQRLESVVRPKAILGSYEPFRHSAGDAVNQQFPFFEDFEATSLDRLEAIVAKACKGDPKLLEMNLAIARSTHRFSTERSLTAEKVDVRPIALCFGHMYEFGMPLIMRHDGKAHVVFPDLRRTNALSAQGCRFVFSAMHQRWRVNYPDMAGLRLSIWRYLNNSARDIRVVECLDSSLISYESLLADVQETYAILHEVLADEDRRRRGSGGSAGPLFGT